MDNAEYMERVYNIHVNPTYIISATFLLNIHRAFTAGYKYGVIK